jgi:hypothetical protein
VPTARIPGSILFYGLLGLIPFLAPPLLSLWVPAHAPFLALVALGYAALILSFLGGARWGAEAQRQVPRFGTISLAMLPTIAGLLLLLAPGLSRPAQLTAMAALLVLHFVWDVRSSGLPPWYPRLRALLTFGAITGLMAMAGIMLKVAEALSATMV